MKQKDNQISLRRFFTERTNLRPESSVQIPETEAKHIRDSLRLEAGTHIVLFNGEKEFEAELGLVTKKVVMANIIRELPVVHVASDLHLTLLQALIKPANFEIVLEKGTELGVDSFIPLETEFGQVKIDTGGKKLVRWEKIMLTACKQSERHSIPTLQPAVRLTSELLSQLNQENHAVIALTLHRQQSPANGEIQNLQDVISQLDTNIKPLKIALLVGPEGGFSPTEHKLFSQSGIHQVEMLQGKILRSETASISAVSLVQELATKR